MANEDVVTACRDGQSKQRSQAQDASSAISGGGCILGRFRAEINILLLVSLAQNKLEPQGKPNWGTTTTTTTTTAITATATATVTTATASASNYELRTTNYELLTTNY